MTDKRDRPLTRGWAEVEAGMRARGKHNEIDIERSRLMFYLGAKIAIVTAARNPMSLMLMSMELRDFDHEEIAKDTTCPVESIS